MFGFGLMGNVYRAKIVNSIDEKIWGKGTEKAKEITTNNNVACVFYLHECMLLC